jgi:hypothetical protein
MRKKIITKRQIIIKFLAALFKHLKQKAGTFIKDNNTFDTKNIRSFDEIYIKIKDLLRVEQEIDTLIKKEILFIRIIQADRFRLRSSNNKTPSSAA